MTEFEQEQRRVAALLGLNKPENDLAAAEPSPSAEQLGARGAMGFTSRQDGVRVSVYFFDDYMQAADARSRADELAPQSGMTHRMTVNGGLLFVGEAPSDHAEAEQHLRRLASAFAGRER